MRLGKAIVDLVEDRALWRDAAASRNWRVVASLLGPAWRGLVLDRGRSGEAASVAVGGDATFDWSYRRAFPELGRLYQAAKSSQWDAATALDWTRPVDPRDPARPLLPEAFYGHVLSRAGWDRLVLGSGMMALFRETMFRLIVPNLKAVGLLSERVRPRWAQLGLLAFEGGKAAPDLTAADLLDDR
jgi:TPR repeat protein